MVSFADADGGLSDRRSGRRSSYGLTVTPASRRCCRYVQTKRGFGGGIKHERKRRGEGGSNMSLARRCDGVLDYRRAYVSGGREDGGSIADIIQTPQKTQKRKKKKNDRIIFHTSSGNEYVWNFEHG